MFYLTLFFSLPRYDLTLLNDSSCTVQGTFRVHPGVDAPASPCLAVPECRETAHLKEPVSLPLSSTSEQRLEERKALSSKIRRDRVQFDLDFGKDVVPTHS